MTDLAQLVDDAVSEAELVDVTCPYRADVGHKARVCSWCSPIEGVA